MQFLLLLVSDLNVFMPKERNKADNYRKKAHAGDTKAMNNLDIRSALHAGLCSWYGQTGRETACNRE